MLYPLSDITKLTRIDFSYDSWVLASGVTGTWVAPGGSENVTKPTADCYAFPIWTESNRDGSAGFSPDTLATGNVTVLYGPFRALTDQFTSTPSVGQKLYTAVDGTLTASGSNFAVAICTKASHSFSWLGKTHTVIEIVTI